jgi:hypothetical protein
MKKREFYSKVQDRVEKDKVGVNSGDVSRVLHSAAQVLLAMKGADLAETIGQWVKKTDKALKKPVPEAIQFRDNIRRGRKRAA